MTIFFLNLISFFLIFKFRFFISQNLKLIDNPSKNKIHKIKSFLLGGLFLFATLIIIYTDNYLSISKFSYINFFLVFSLFAIGLLDDAFKLSAGFKLLLSIFFISLTVSTDNNLIIKSLNFYSADFYHFSDNWLIRNIFPIFCIIVLVNAINFTDGINGLTSIICLSIIIYIIFKIPNIFQNLYLIIFTIIILIFLNIKKNIFLGDSGNHLLSGIVASLILRSNFEKPNLFFVEEIFLIFIIPGLDFLRLIIVRIYSKKSPMRGDLNHLHHILLKKYSLIKILFLFVFLINTPLYLYLFFKVNILFCILLSTVIYFYLIKDKFLK